MTDKLLIGRELLERLAGNGPTSTISATREIREILAAPRQPEGEGLEVVGYRCWFKKEPENIMVEWGKRAPAEPNPYSEHEELCRLSDHLRAIAELREECERLRSECARLESKYERDVWGLNNEGDPIGGDHPSGFANDLLRVTIERDTLRQQRDKLAGLLLGLKVSVRDRAAGRAILADDVYKLIDAALAEVNKWI